MLISDWSSDVCSSDLDAILRRQVEIERRVFGVGGPGGGGGERRLFHERQVGGIARRLDRLQLRKRLGIDLIGRARRSEEHTSELQSLMRISYAVFCLKKKKHNFLIPSTHCTQTPRQ